MARNLGLGSGRGTPSTEAGDPIASSVASHCPGEGRKEDQGVPLSIPLSSAPDGVRGDGTDNPAVGWMVQEGGKREERTWQEVESCEPTRGMCVSWVHRAGQGRAGRGEGRSGSRNWTLGVPCQARELGLYSLDGNHGSLPFSGRERHTWNCVFETAFWLQWGLGGMGWWGEEWLRVEERSLQTSQGEAGEHQAWCLGC